MLSAPPIAGPTQEQQKANEGAGAAAGQISEDMVNQASLLPASLSRINLIEKSIGQFQAGGGADFRAQVKKGLQSLQNLGLLISDDAIGKAGSSDMVATQVFNSQVKPYVMGVLRESIKGTGKAMRPEVDAIMQSLSATTDPKAIMANLSQARNILHIAYDMGQKFTDFRQSVANGAPEVKGFGPSDYLSYYYRHPTERYPLPQIDLGENPFAGISTAPAASATRPPLDSYFKP
jgi:hypothetical protein